MRSAFFRIFPHFFRIFGRRPWFTPKKHTKTMPIHYHMKVFRTNLVFCTNKDNIEAIGAFFPTKYPPGGPGPYSAHGLPIRDLAKICPVRARFHKFHHPCAFRPNLTLLLISWMQKAAVYHVCMSFPMNWGIWVPFHLISGSFSAF